MIKVFAALSEEANVSRASEKLGISQPAASHALGRLRIAFNDPLFVKGPKGMLPTPKALELKEALPVLLQTLEDFYSPHSSEELSARTDTLKVAGTDYLESILFGKAFNAFQSEAPNCRVLSKNLSGKLPQKELEDGEIDIAVAGYFRDIPNQFYQQTLFEDEFVCVTSKKYAPKTKNLSLDQYLDLTHVLTALEGDFDGIVDKKLRQKRQKRKVALAFSNFTSPFFALQESPLVFTCLSKLAYKMAHSLEIKIFPSPISLPKVKIAQIWHERTNQDPLYKSLRKSLKQSASEL